MWCFIWFHGIRWLHWNSTTSALRKLQLRSYMPSLHNNTYRIVGINGRSSNDSWQSASRFMASWARSACMQAINHHPAKHSSTPAVAIATYNVHSVSEMQSACIHIQHGTTMRHTANRTRAIAVATARDNNVPYRMVGHQMSHSNSLAEWQ